MASLLSCPVQILPMTNKRPHTFCGLNFTRIIETYADNTFLPFLLLAASTFLPFAVLILFLKPCSLLLCLFLGWNVIFIDMHLLCCRVKDCSFQSTATIILKKLVPVKKKISTTHGKQRFFLDNSPILYENSYKKTYILELFETLYAISCKKGNV